MAIISGPSPCCRTVIPTNSRLQNSHSPAVGAATCLCTKIWTRSPTKQLKSPLLRLGIVACLPSPSLSTSEESDPLESLSNSKKLFVSGSMSKGWKHCQKRIGQGITITGQTGLSFSTTEENFRKCFSRFGQLVEAKIIIDRFAKRSKGFGFIEYATEIEAQEAILGMDGKFLDGRVIFVEIAKPKLTRPSLPRATGPPKILRDTIELIERSQ